MATSGRFRCSVVTPEQPVLECDVTSVVFPAHDGARGVMANHAPFLCKVGIGVLTVHAPEGNRTMFVDGGFAQIVENRLTILTEQAKNPEELSGEDARRALAGAQSLTITDDASYAARDRAIRRAQTQIKLSR